jgi:hypothetical protein
MDAGGMHCRDWYIAQIIGWGSERLENRELIDLLPAWQGKRFALLLHSGPVAENQRTNFG